MTEIEEAVAMVDAFVAHLEGRPGALAFGSGKVLRPKILRTILSALTASQAEVERLRKGHDQLHLKVSRTLADLSAAEARATRAEALVATYACECDPGRCETGSTDDATCGLRARAFLDKPKGEG